MSAPGLAIAREAESLMGTPFRLHGRDPRFGLDCIGLVAQALKQAGHRVSAPTGYALRTTDVGHYLRFAPASGLRSSTGPRQPGDIMMVRPGPAQFHLLVAGPQGGFIHAHAGLRKVVAAWLDPSWPIVRQWRHQSSF